MKADTSIKTGTTANMKTSLPVRSPAPRPTTDRPVRGSRLVASAVVQILVVVLILVTATVLISRNALETARTTERAKDASTVAASLEAVSEANVGLESAFDSAAALPDVGERALQLGPATSTGIKGTGEYSTYVERSLNLATEAGLRSAYQRATDAWDALAARFGPQLVSASTAATAISATLAQLHTLQTERQARLSDLRGLYLTAVAHDEAIVARTQRSISNSAPWLIAALITIGVVAVIAATRRATRVARTRARIEDERAATERRTTFEARLQRSMALAPDETMALQSVAHTFDVTGYQAAELLVANGDTSSFERVIEPRNGTGCGVGNASDCPAVRLRQRLDFSDADAIDSCPFLRDRSGEVGQSVCIPVTIADHTVAVMRAESPAGEVLSAEQADWIAIIARNTGEKIGTLRTFAASQYLAATDPLTGLANRRTLELARGTRMTSGAYAVVFADIDHFKDLNDTFGHDVGDDCLRTFARVLDRATRPGDLCTRYGGEEFVVLLPDANSQDAEAIATRTQALLAEQFTNTQLARFTVSIGVASSEHGSTLDEVVRAADHAMFAAKAAGRNRIVVEAV